ncbi:MAG: Coenzyme A biosynthesis bifunctional protein CoaBC [Candidatus Heimdallarchaeota archaeon LC_3]|nr:MAG: Coenzyme A biosynthesis bifunctional protein CoaBC [Candidatus Heimdallarchaeota archaeon LC_3]
MVRIDVKSELLSTAPYPRLKGEKILFAVTGSVAAYRMVDVVRELIRLGAEIHVMMSPDSLNLIHEATFEWASGNKVITEITGNIEHVLYAGEHEEHVDLMIIAPASANSISKIATGIADTNVSLTAAVAIGNNIPLLVVPGMHAPMFNNPVLKKRISELKNLDQTIIMSPRIEEGKAKVPNLEIIVQNAIRLLTPQTFENRQVLISGGATREYIDNVRFISNPASGKTAFYLALEAWYRGATVDLIMGNSEKFDVPFQIKTTFSAEDMFNEIKEVMKTKKPDAVILSAAVSDYKPVTYIEGKLKSGHKELSLNLEPTIKILKQIKSFNENCVLIGFKAEHHPTIDKLKDIFNKYFTDSKIDLLVANDISEKGAGFGTTENHIWIISKNQIAEYKGHKEKLAEEIINYLLKL